MAAALENRHNNDVVKVIILGRSKSSLDMAVISGEKCTVIAKSLLQFIWAIKANPMEHFVLDPSHITSIVSK